MQRPSDLRRVVEEAVNDAVRILTEYGQEDKANAVRTTRIIWSDRLVTSAGTAKAGARIVKLARRIFENEATLADLRETVLHELAHIICPGHKHDIVWQTWAKRLGSSGEECHKLAVPQRAFRNPSQDAHCQRCFETVKIGPSQAKSLRRGKRSYRHKMRPDGSLCGGNLQMEPLRIQEAVLDYLGSQTATDNSKEIMS